MKQELLLHFVAYMCMYINFYEFFYFTNEDADFNTHASYSS